MSKVLLHVPFVEKDRAKALGAKWDFVQKSWYIYSDMEPEPFRKWLPETATIQKSSTPSTSTTFLPETGISLTDYLQNISQAVRRASANAVWIRAEVSRLDLKRGHCFLEVVDSDSSGKQTAKCHAIIWQSQAQAILTKFQDQTGGQLKDGMKILFHGRAELSTLYGLSIHIDDIDPNYTLGNLMANLIAIRTQLQQNNLYTQNKQLPTPKEFTEVAVISPENAAGLGDFRREADLLARHKLCNFTYYEALFQGKAAAKEIAAQIDKVITDNAKKSYDVLVIIRGGGAQTDLAWLNDYQIASRICAASIPVFSGIGHERDNTIIDEVACQRFDTPSKVIEHIWATITNNAKTANTQIEQIIDRTSFVLKKNQEQIKFLLASSLREAKHNINAHQTNLNALFTNLVAGAQKSVQQIDQKQKHFFEQISYRVKTQITLLDTELKNIFHGDIIPAAYRSIQNVQDSLFNLTQLIYERSTQQIKTIKVKLEHLKQTINLCDPTNILQRGFVLIRSKNKRLITSKQSALTAFRQDQELELNFKDGDLTIIDIKQKGDQNGQQ